LNSGAPVLRALVVQRGHKNEKETMVRQTPFSLIQIVVCLLCGSISYASNLREENEISVAPTTLAPIAAPTTLAPIAAPTTLAPIAAPTTLAPIAAPTTLAPIAAPTTLAPIAAPTTLAPPTGAPISTTTPTNAPTNAPLCRLSGFEVVGIESSVAIRNGDILCAKDIVEFQAIAVVGHCSDSTVRMRLKNVHGMVVRSARDEQAPFTVNGAILPPSRKYTLTAIPDGNRSMEQVSGSECVGVLGTTN
jgi:hypothetical protein